MTNRKTTVKAEGKYTIEDMQKHASVASTADGLKLEGPNFKLTCLTACPDMLLFACEELAKANERVSELEKENDLAITRLMAAALALASGKECPAALEALNKFAIENQIKGVENAIKYSDDNANFVDSAGLEDYLDSELRPQLHKKQENG